MFSVFQKRKPNCMEKKKKKKPLLSESTSIQPQVVWHQPVHSTPRAVWHIDYPHLDIMLPHPTKLWPGYTGQSRIVCMHLRSSILIPCLQWKTPNISCYWAFCIWLKLGIVSALVSPLLTLSLPQTLEWTVNGFISLHTLRKRQTSKNKRLGAWIQIVPQLVN